ncbi:hypothetical protein AB3M83_08380 [Microbacterium sp. 179-B 1A2 NHS]|uniref:DUF6993 domain-containing protein n=1 Tax=Microbacterium sp. 179-B 1A2 NHS TaxID=3142383 RepID=UPI0039A36B51
MRRHPSEMIPRLLVVTIGAGVIAGLVGCTPGDATPSPSPTPTPTATATPSATPTPAETIPGGSAQENLDRFAAVVDEVWGDSRSVQGRDYVDALVDAGFEKDAMEVTFDRTSVDDPADSIQFSVHIADECLVGQVGPSVEGSVTRVLPEVPGDTCLIGETRPIDW